MKARAAIQAVILCSSSAALCFFIFPVIPPSHLVFSNFAFVYFALFLRTILSNNYVFLTSGTKCDAIKNPLVKLQCSLVVAPALSAMAVPETAL